ncbi:MAG: histidinol dehydrogenase [Deltaproteobacteria bacterium]|nr:histidinol dehydrogenase [Deltaproteobacteria bacterium]
MISRVHKEGDAALAEYTLRFDGFDPRKKGFAVSAKEIDAAWRRTPKALKESLSFAAGRIEAFHAHQAQSGYTAEIPGAILGQRVIPVSRAGVYVPGGKAAYPSTLLMNSIPARVAGVRQVIVACPAPGGKIPDVVLAAARIAGVSAVYRLGGAQAIAALAYGTESVPKVDVVAGPGNAYVTEAKRQVYGIVGIDMLAGPSELAVLADGSAKPSYVAADLLSQAEHDEDAFVALVTDSAALSRKVEAEILRQAGRLPRRKILDASLSRARGFLVRGLKEGIETINAIAPEHLSIMVENPWSALEGVRNAGTAFLGPYSPVAVGDYVAGINHTLPTGGAAAFSSPLGVGNFLKRMNVVSYQIRALTADAPHVARLAGKEGLAAHAQAVRERIDKEA